MTPFPRSKQNRQTTFWRMVPGLVYAAPRGIVYRALGCLLAVMTGVIVVSAFLRITLYQHGRRGITPDSMPSTR